MTVFHKDTKILKELDDIETHVHSDARWFGKSTDQTGNIWGADNLAPYQVITGPSCAYSTAATSVAKVIGPADTPVQSGMVKFDLHRILIVAVSTDVHFKMRCIHGSSTSTLNGQIAVGHYSEWMLKFDQAVPTLPEDSSLSFVTRLSFGDVNSCSLPRQT